MISVVIPAAEMRITVVVVGLAVLEVLMGAGCLLEDRAVCYVNPVAHVQQTRETSQGVFILTDQMIVLFLSRGMLTLNDSP